MPLKILKGIFFDYFCSTNNMRRKFILTVSLSVLISQVAIAQVDFLWKHSIKNSLNSINKSVAIQTDKWGNCYMTGTSWIPDSTKDVLLIKFDPQGREEWRRLYDHPDHRDDVPVAMSLDPFGNILIACMSRSDKSMNDILLLKFSPEGALEIEKKIDGGHKLFDAPVCITADDRAHILVGGYVTTPDSGLNAVLYRFSPEGKLLWSKRAGTKDMDIFNAIISDDSCNVYVAGNYKVAQRSSDFIIQKYDSSGTKMWEYIYDGMLSMSDGISHLASDDSLNIYFSGFINKGSDRSDVPLFKMDRNGKSIQENLFFGGMSDCRAKHLYVNASGVYMTLEQTNYNMGGQSSNTVLLYGKGGRQEFSMNSRQDFRYDRFIPVDGMPLILGTGLTRPENTLIPFIAEPDTSEELVWMFTDNEVYGLTNMIDYAVHGKRIFFLGDDTGEATGTITLLCYNFLNPNKKSRRWIAKLSDCEVQKD
ncbi:MAG: hypothetical protein DWQ44_02935 [Bacteroidetes bacterium]|nr:MAG: hypothetical protein DWQ39_14135 [Bacteroidota bacterium]REK35780.1 MAG: hypothetical protein DWQ44_02935 [Bacteroidota bacterium]REK49347.1 MAG: hypothetical protein DWQ48_07915 [Bacteroidota bacterium]